MPASMLSVNGQLRSLYYDATEEVKRSQGYKPIEIGKPLMIQYLRFFVAFKDKEKEKEVMISTFLKAADSRWGRPHECALGQRGRHVGLPLPVSETAPSTVQIQARLMHPLWPYVKLGSNQS